MNVSDKEIFNILGIEIEEDIINKHNYISDKLILDVINGVKNVAKDLNDTSKAKEKGFARVWDNIRGDTKKRQNQINENLIQGLNATTEWLKDHDRHISRIDERISIIANEIEHTQDEIYKFYGDYKVLKEAFNERNIYVQEQIHNIDIRDRAYNQINREISKFKANEYEKFDLPIQIYVLLDNLKSGYGGIYYDNERNPKEKNEFYRYISNEIKNSLNEYGGSKLRKEFINFENMIEKTNQLPQSNKNILAFIASQHRNEILQKEIRPEVAQLILLVANESKEESLKNINAISHIRTFITYDELIEDTIKEHLII